MGMLVPDDDEPSKLDAYRVGHDLSRRQAAEFLAYKEEQESELAMRGYLPMMGKLSDDGEGLDIVLLSIEDTDGGPSLGRAER